MQDDQTRKNAIDSLERQLEDLVAESMLSGRKLNGIKTEIENLTGTIEQQWEVLQKLRRELKEPA